MFQTETRVVHDVITVYNEKFDHLVGGMQALAKKMTQWKEGVFFALKLARQKLSKYSAHMTPTMDMHLVSTHIFDSFRKL